MTSDLPQGGILYEVVNGVLVVQLWDETGARMTYQMDEVTALKAIEKLASCLGVLQQIREARA